MSSCQHKTKHFYDEKDIVNDGAAYCTLCGEAFSEDTLRLIERAEKAEARVEELERENRRLKILSGAFRGVVEGDVKDKMVKFWMKQDDISMNAALKFYWCRDAELLCNKLAEPCWFIPDDKETCFELEDGNWVSPRNIIVEVDE